MKPSLSLLLALVTMAPLTLAVLPVQVPFSFSSGHGVNAILASPQGSNGSASQVSCPAGSTLTWGSISLNCFQTLNIAEIAAILIGVGIALWAYWDYERAELPGESSEVPVTAEEEVRSRESREAR